MKYKMKLKRSERIVVMTEYLLNNPNKLIPLTYFVAKFNQAIPLLGIYTK